MELVKFLDFPIKGDERGSLIALESLNNIPFDIKRVYYIFNNKPDVVRGKHAHKNLSQVLVCIKGSCRIILDNGIQKESVLLDRPNRGLLIENMIWREMCDFSVDCVLLVLASAHYNEDDYIRNYEEFLRNN